MLALLDRTSRKARFFLGTCPGTHRRLPGPDNKPTDKETIEEGRRADIFPSLNADADTIVPSALIEPLALASKRPVAADFDEDHAPYEQVVSQAEPSLSPAASSTAPCQTIQHFFAGASHFTVGQLNNYTICAEELRMQVQVLQAHIAQRGLSQPVGYTRENGVRIVDALGGELILPPSIIRQYSVTSVAVSQK
ncbi:hypothetical protein FA13DRAFT_316441 [Coprinellus micaceus]|uniref:Uncharacterized protein n=1 Tax=Coprinellus micaceus TaxID=71717 RepID=A0A4Y7TCS3_COPMI|nr:hypothetical protein FA13DRAFT_316441 [Coprinellus micaceus]